MHIVTCRCCKEKFDCDVEPFVMPSRNWYYHKFCYESPDKAEEENEFWLNQIYHYLHNTVKMSYNFIQCEKQRTQMIAKHQYNNKGIYFALKYFYEVKHGTFKEEYGLGIVPKVYDDSRTYWYKREQEQQNFMRDLEATLRKEYDGPVIIKSLSTKHRQTKKIEFDDIMEGDDD